MPITDCRLVAHHSPGFDMPEPIIEILDAVGGTLYALFVMPGSFLLSKFVQIAPVTAMRHGISAGQTEGTLPIVLSLIAWIALLLLLVVVLRIARSWTRLAGAMIRTACHRLKATASGYKTRLVLKLRSLLPHRPDNAIITAPAIEFDDLDLAVLHTVSEQGPGFTLSAPELAERLSLLPGPIQRSLEKLNRNKMLNSVIGSTDGFENYRLSESGAAFVSMWQRQQARG